MSDHEHEDEEALARRARESQAETEELREEAERELSDGPAADEEERDEG